MSSRTIAAALAFVMLPAVATHAAVIDFSGLTPGFQNSSTLVLSNATIVTLEDTAEIDFDIFVYAPVDGGAGGFCATANAVCIAPATIGFTGAPVSGLSFEVFNFDPGDSALTLVFSDIFGAPIASRNIDGAGLISFGDLAGIQAIAMLFTGDPDGSGVSYRDFSFEQQDTNTPVIPLPATLPLLVGALGAGALLRQRRRG